MGTDDTRFMFTTKANDSVNLTAQFGARQSIDETISDDNTQALFGVPQQQQTCTEAFFANIHDNNTSRGSKNHLSGQQLKEMTVRF